MSHVSDKSLATSTAPAHLDLRPRNEKRANANVMLRASAVEAGLHTATCPQCGINPAGAASARTFQYVPPWVYIGLLLNIIILAIMYYSGRRRLYGTLSLCADCAAADARGRQLRSISVVGLVLFPIVMATAGAFIGGEMAALAGVFAGIFAGVSGMIAAHGMTKFDVINCRLIDRKKDILELSAGASFARVLAAEAPAALDR